jgi:hypothetical protein
MHNMEEEGVVTNFSQRHKVLAVAMATVFIGSESAKAKATTEIEVNEPINNFTQAYREYASAIRSGSSSLSELVDLAEQTYELGKVKFGPRHGSTILLQQNLANAHLEAGNYVSSALHYASVIDYYGDTQGDDSQPYYFALLDIINLLHSADKASSLSAEDIGIARYGQERAMLQLFDTTEALVSRMPESSLIFQAHTVKTAIRSKWSEKNTRLLNMAKLFHKEALKSQGESSHTYLEALLYVAQIQFAMNRNKPALLNFESILDTIQANAIEANAIAISAHAHLVSVYAKKKDTQKAIQHSQALAKRKDLKGNGEVLYQVAARLAGSKTGSISANKKRDAVTLIVDISPQGQAVKIRMKRKSSQAVAEAAMLAVQQWFFVPKLVNEVFVTGEGVEVNVDFIHS